MAIILIETLKISLTRLRKVFMAFPSEYQRLTALYWEQAKQIQLGPHAKLLHEYREFINTNTCPSAVSADGPVRQARK